MPEEVRNASVNVPRAIIFSILLNGILGFGMLVAVLFCLVDINRVLASPTGYPYLEIFLEATQSVAGSAVMGSILPIIGFGATVGTLTCSTRLFWSFSRDRGLLGWRVMKMVCL
jgi:choline transport protein